MSKKINFLSVTDDDGYTCLLDRWHSESNGKYGIAASVYSPEGKKILHLRESNFAMTSRGALKAIKTVRTLSRCVTKEQLVYK